MRKKPCPFWLLCPHHRILESLILEMTSKIILSTHPTYHQHCPLSHVPKYHICAFLEYLWGSDSSISLGSLFQCPNLTCFCFCFFPLSSFSLNITKFCGTVLEIFISQRRLVLPTSPTFYVCFEIGFIAKHNTHPVQSLWVLAAATLGCRPVETKRKASA